MHNGSHSQKENRHVPSRVAERDRERDGRRPVGGYLFSFFNLVLPSPKIN